MELRGSAKGRSNYWVIVALIRGFDMTGGLLERERDR